MEKVHRQKKSKRILTALGALVLALGVGVAVAPRAVVKAEAATTTVVLPDHTKEETQDLTTKTMFTADGSLKDATNASFISSVTSTSKVYASPAGFKFGSSSLPGKWTFKTIEIVTKIVVELNKYGSDSSTVKLTSNTDSKSKTSGTIVDGTKVTLENISSNDFSIVAQNGKKCRFYVKSIEFSYGASGPVKSLSSIAVTTQPTKKDYIVGESFNKSGMVVTATYSDSSTLDVTDQVTVTPEPLTLGLTSVTASYTEGSVTETTTISGLSVTAAPVLQLIYVTGTPKLEYYVGDVFDPSGLTVWAKYDKGADKDVTAQAIFPTTQLTLEDTSVTVTYEEKTTSITGLTVIKPDFMSATMMYPKDDSTTNMTGNNDAATVGLDPLLFTVIADKGGKVQNVGLNNDGTIRLYAVKDTGNGNTLTVSVDSDYEIVSFEVKYGGTVALIRIEADGDEIYVSIPEANSSVLYEEIDASSFSIKNIYKENTQLWIESIIINYKLKENVQEKTLTSLTYSGELVKKEYFNEDVFDSSGLTFTATFSDTSTADVSNLVTFANNGKLSTGMSSIVASFEYGEITETTTVTGFTVVTRPSLVGISVTKNPDKMSYVKGTAFETDGMVVTATYSDSSTGPVTGYSVLPEVLTSVGNEVVTISYEYFGVTKSTTLTVEVLDGFSPENIVVHIGDNYDNESESNAEMDLNASILDILSGSSSSLLESATAGTKVFYGGTKNTLNEIQPLKLGTGSAVGSIKLTFSDEISNISKVTVFAARRTTGKYDAAVKVNDEPLQTIGKKGSIDSMYSTFEFTGKFGNEITISSGGQLAIYIYGLDIEYTTYKDEADAFANEVMTGSGFGAKGNCQAVLEGLETMYDGLSETAQLEFETNPDELFENARARLDYLRAWVALNEPSSPRSSQSKTKTNALVAALVIGAIGITTLGGYFFLNRKKEKIEK